MKNNINVETIKKLESAIAWHEDECRSAAEGGYTKYSAEQHYRLMGMIEVLVALGYDVMTNKDGKTIITGI